jgi:hypothetical protein
LVAISTLIACGRAANNPDPDLPNAGAGGLDSASGGQLSVGGEEAAAAGQAPALGGANQATAGGAGGITDAEAGGGAASENPCEPDARTCDGPSVKVCGPSGLVIESTCSPSQLCKEGACASIVCVPNATFCGDGQVRSCSEDGTSSTLTQACNDTQFCVEHAGGAECSETFCPPGGALCVNDVATVCKPDGSGPKPGGDDCAQKGSVCQDGKCTSKTCEPGQKLCEHDDVYICVGGGAKSVLFTDCTTEEACDPVLTACRPRLCEPGKLSCDGTRVVTCNALGTGWNQSGTDCSKSSQQCTAGSCQTQVCVPSSSFCKAGDVYACDAAGLVATLSSVCTNLSQHCVAYNNGGNAYAYCSSNFCSPGAAACNGNVLTKCNADGSGYEVGGTDCGAGMICNSGLCKPKVCEPYSYSCKDGDIISCYYDGLSYYVQQDCGGDARCLKPDGSNPACVPYDCSPGLKACLGNQVGTCAADGTSLATVGKDCSATDQVCTNSATCGAEAVDVLGVSEDLQSLGDGQFFGDVIDVTSNRQLTQLEASIVLASSRTLRWAIFELVNGSYEARYDKVLSNQTGSGTLSSGPISYTLKAGRRYLLGVAVDGGGFVPYLDAKPWQPEISFGRAVGGLVASYSTAIYAGYLDANRLFDMRTTTSLP